MLETLLSAWAMNEADFVEVVALSAWVTSDPPYLAIAPNLG